MANQNIFIAKLQKKWDEQKFVCVGLDQSSYIANKKIVDETYEIVSAFKPNSAFYEENGAKGWEDLKKIINYIKSLDASLPIILDAKRGDIGNTNLGYVKAIFDYLNADAVTVHPYLGKEALMPFLNRADKGVIVLVKTSNPGSGEFQDLLVGNVPIYKVVAQHVAKDWNNNNNCAVVVGATYPQALKDVRKIIGEDMPILIPGIGTQGGDLRATVKAGKNSKNQGIIVNSSRGIIFAPDPKAATLKLHQDVVNSLKL